MSAGDAGPPDIAGDTQPGLPDAAPDATPDVPIDTSSPPDVWPDVVRDDILPDEVVWDTSPTDDTGELPPPERRTYVIGVRGGTAALDDGALLEIPAGALSGDTPVTVSSRRLADGEAPDGLVIRGAIYEIDPNPRVFGAISFLTLPVDDDPTRVAVYDMGEVDPAPLPTWTGEGHVRTLLVPVSTKPVLPPWVGAPAEPAVCATESWCQDPAPICDGERVFDPQPVCEGGVCGTVGEYISCTDRPNAASTCEGGACRVDVCVEGWEDQDGRWDNGCEVWVGVPCGTHAECEDGDPCSADSCGTLALCRSVPRLAPTYWHAALVGGPPDGALLCVLSQPDLGEAEARSRVLNGHVQSAYLDLLVPCAGDYTVTGQAIATLSSVWGPATFVGGVDGNVDPATGALSAELTGDLHVAPGGDAVPFLGSIDGLFVGHDRFEGTFLLTAGEAGATAGAVCEGTWEAAPRCVAGNPTCMYESDCDDGFDNDNDRRTDCADPDCSGALLSEDGACANTIDWPVFAAGDAATWTGCLPRTWPPAGGPHEAPELVDRECLGQVGFVDFGCVQAVDEMLHCAMDACWGDCGRDAACLLDCAPECQDDRYGLVERPLARACRREYDCDDRASGDEDDLVDCDDPDCAAPDGCPPPPPCGDGAIDPDLGEECDPNLPDGPAVFGAASCADAPVFGEGGLICRNDCTIDRSACASVDWCAELDCPNRSPMPRAVCLDDDTVRYFRTPGTCDAEERRCEFPAEDHDCQVGWFCAADMTTARCYAGEPECAVHDDCSHITPPIDTCVPGGKLRRYWSRCSLAGVCYVDSHDYTCDPPEMCRSGQCMADTTPDCAVPADCGAAPLPDCGTDDEVWTYRVLCWMGTCWYDWSRELCGAGELCRDAACVASCSEDGECTDGPASHCLADGATLRTYPGVCGADSLCDYGAAVDLVCEEAPESHCTANSGAVRHYVAVCVEGACGHEPTDEPCPSATDCRGDTMITLLGQCEVDQCEQVEDGPQVDCTAGGQICEEGACVDPPEPECTDENVLEVCLDVPAAGCVDEDTQEVWDAVCRDGACQYEPRPVDCPDGHSCVGGVCVDEGTSVCGNDVAEPGEACDGEDLRGQSCTTLGLGVGTLTCVAPELPGACTLERSGCAQPELCGDPETAHCDDPNCQGLPWCCLQCDDRNACTFDLCTGPEVADCVHLALPTGEWAGAGEGMISVMGGVPEEIPATSMAFTIDCVADGTVGGELTFTASVPGYPSLPVVVPFEGTYEAGREEWELQLEGTTTVMNVITIDGTADASLAAAVGYRLEGVWEASAAGYFGASGTWWAIPACLPGLAGCQTEAYCGDGVDNDGDGRADCETCACLESEACVGVVEVCDDGVDNDGDGLVDCQDPVCGECTTDVCCQSAYDCSDGDPCTRDECDDTGQCRNPPWELEPGAPCCHDDGDCPDDGFACTSEYCGLFGGKADVPGSDYPICMVSVNHGPCDDDDPCTQDRCAPDEAGAVDGCVNSFVVGCCRTDDDCEESPDGPYCVDRTCTDVLPVEDCANGVDDDRDGRADCGDTEDCAEHPACLTPCLRYVACIRECAVGDADCSVLCWQQNEAGGMAFMMLFQCVLAPCGTPGPAGHDCEGYPTEALLPACTTPGDADGQCQEEARACGGTGAACASDPPDCGDPNCICTEACLSGYTSCDDGLDNDADGLIDDAEPRCGCTPSCDPAWACGDDGCGGSCGEGCEPGETCQDHACVPTGACVGDWFEPNDDPGEARASLLADAAAAPSGTLNFCPAEGAETDPDWYLFGPPGPGVLALVAYLDEPAAAELGTWEGFAYSQVYQASSRPRAPDEPGTRLHIIEMTREVSDQMYVIGFVGEAGAYDITYRLEQPD